MAPMLRPMKSNMENEQAVSDSEQESIPQQLKRRSSSVSSIFSLHEEPLPRPAPEEFLKFTQDERHLSFIRSLHMADCITMLNGFSGFYSIISCLRFAFSNGSATHYLQRAIFFNFLGLFFDIFDGKVARLRNKSSLIGQELDSLADLISFGVAPCCVAFCCGMTTTVDCLMLVFMVLCGLGRLARFNVTVANIPKDDAGKSKYFEGFPIPTSLWILLMLLLFIHNGTIGFDSLPGGLIYPGTSWEFHPLTTVYLLQGCFMISKSLHIPKP
ncbi:CDP-diacylglycerol-serine O-phosphatidyltransferase [Martiniozyma asiatica (nom. inval.)]|nr:CDP-diacylglycerol-serine O-phosphatidyltransferase [Martiniozyma asiatica]